MDLARASVWSAVAIIVGVAVVSGPLVGAVDLTTEQKNEAPPGSGHARVTVISTPDQAVLEKGEYGSGSYYLRVPDAVIRLQSVSGKPLLAYKIAIHGLGYSRGTTHFLSKDNEGRMNVSLSTDALAPDEIDEDQYRGELTLLIRDDSGERILVEKNVTIVVRG